MTMTINSKRSTETELGDTCAVIVAAGRGVRMNSAVPKQYLPLAGKPVLAHTLAVFDACRSVDRIVVVAAAEEFERCRRDILPAATCRKPVLLAEGGARRGDSVRSGLKTAGRGTGVAVIHDGVRPLIRPDQISRVVAVARKVGACILAAPAFDTLKAVDADQRICETLDRSRIWMAQTPQAFRFELIVKAHEKAAADGVSGTDDAFLVERMHLPVHVVEGDAFNLKITTARDLEAAEALLKQRVRR